MLNSKELNDLVSKVFNKLLHSKIIKITDSKIYFNINEEEVILKIFKRCTKEKFKDNEPCTVENVQGNRFIVGWTLITPDSELLDFYLIIRERQYRVPRPSLKEYAEWVELLNSQLDNYEQNLFKKLLQ